MDILGTGLRRLLGAIRGQNIPLVLLGAAIVAIGLARRIEPPGDTLVYSKKLKTGESIRVRLAGAEDQTLQIR